jgi:hypothetical protein
MKEAIIKLLRESKIINEDFDDRKITLSKVGLMPKNTIYKIYERRSKITNVVPKELVNNLRDFQGTEILLTSVKKDGSEFLLFTNADITYLIGVTNDLTPNFNI